MAALMAVSCAPKEQYANRAEKILAEINDPNSEYVVVISHRGDWRNYPENSIPAIESMIRMGVDHAYPYYKEIVELVNELGVTGQVLMEGTRRSSKKAEAAAEVEAPAVE